MAVFCLARHFASTLRGDGQAFGPPQDEARKPGVKKVEYEVHVIASGKRFRCNAAKAKYYAEANEDEEKEDVALEVFEVGKNDKLKEVTSVEIALDED